MEKPAYHVPVLLHESIDGLNIDPNGVYVDVTFGGGGHSRSILKKLDKGRLFAFDQDEDAKANVPDDDRFTLIDQNFRYMENYLRLFGVRQVDGILADLGVSSHQFNEAERGFSFRFDAPLDMRMSQKSPLTAAKFIADSSVDELATVLRQYGEMNGAGRVARTLKSIQPKGATLTTGEVIQAIQPMVPALKANKFQAQVFQALRIAVNDEMGALKAMLEQSERILKPGGRLVVISYHSLEDRLVKYFMRSGNFDDDLKKDFYGNPLCPFKTISRGSVNPTEEENENNSRARSARMRIAEHI
ncbi:MAG: 16S rRNA (cytosine(1402)-N(4))-methyltransferase RsmH [Flavobacteriales bacterium]|nr:16S rRNA (cytosine(1402)-N(4))-methyltransferase RsmH [Flavobacteriales bacterium]MDP4953861.1 16S rRNA (cytosine(1402)-N(4))-methyltransferase RsmH [Flavobacteriales bacterium]